MGRYSNPNCREYQFEWQCYFSMAAKRSGTAGANEARRSISLWRAMRRRLAAGDNPSLLDYRRGPDPHHFLFYRNKINIDKAIRLGMSTEAMERRSLFDALRYHQTYRGFQKLMKAHHSRR